MSGSSTRARQLMSAFRAGARAAITAADPNGNVLIDEGLPEPAYPDDLVLIMGCDASQSQATMSTNRSREEVTLLTVHFLCRRSDYQQANDAAYANLDLVERYCRMPPGSPDNAGSPFFGVCREIFLTHHAWRPATLPGDPSGRYSEIVATFTARDRVLA